MAAVTMRTTISGGFDGRDYPPAGEVLDGISDQHAADLVASGLAVATKSGVVEKRPASRAKAETRKSRETA